MKLFVKILKAWWFPWLTLGAILRLTVAAVTVHPDTWALNFTSYLFAFRGIPNIYDYLASLSPFHEWSKLYGPAVFTYPPFAYFTLGTFMAILKPFFNFSFMNWFVNHSLNESFGNPEIFRHLFLLKLPYLFFDLGIALLLLKEGKGKFLLWIFNPLAFYSSFMVGQFDVIPVFFVILGLYLAASGRKNWAVVSLGIGGSLKLFPLLFLPLFVLIMGKNNWEKAKLAVLGILPYSLTILPFLSSPAFRQVVLFSNQSQKMLFMGLPVSGAETIYVFVFFLVMLWLWVGYGKRQISDLWKYVLVTLLLFFSVTHYHPQWFLWVTPFLIWELTENNFRHVAIVVILFFCWLTITFLFEPSLSYGLFSPLWPKLGKVQGLSEFLSPYINVFQFKSITRSIFAGASLFLVFRLFADEKVNA
ncbi:MAG: hypothetical protein ACOZBZ_01910 [Patescibacteria group bacterium]